MLCIASAVTGLTACGSGHLGRVSDAATPPAVDAAADAAAPPDVDAAALPDVDAATAPDGLALTPPMGWNTWYGLHCDGYNEQVLHEIADAMVSTGLRDAGYRYLIIDDCWQVSRNAQGVIVPDPAKFPSGMAALADYVHARGLKLGIYTDVGPKTCKSRPGSLHHEVQDAATYASWGVDFIKEDWCFNTGLTASVQYQKMKDAIAQTDRPMVLSICNWGQQATWEWAPHIGQLWRTTADVGPTWAGISRNLTRSGRLAAIAGPGGWNDPDFIVAGLQKATAEEYKTQFTMWAMMAAPLVLSADLRHIDPATLAMVKNPEVIAIDQDPRGVQGTIVGLDGGIQIWAKPLATDGSRAVALYNPGTTAQSGTVHWSELGLADGSYPIRDPLNHKDLGSMSSYTATVPPHGAALIVVAGAEVNPPHGDVEVSDLRWAYAASGWGPPERDKSNNGAGYDGNPLRLRGKTYAKGIGAHAPSRFRILLGGRCHHFHAVVGIDDEVGPGRGHASFEVLADGRQLYASPVVTSSSPALTIETSLDGAQVLELVARGADGSLDFDHVDWADARLSCDP